MSLRIGGYGGGKGIKDENVVVVVTKGEGDNSPVVEIQNSTEVEFAYYGPDIVFEFRHICQPLHVGRIGMEAATQVILRHIRGRCRAAGAAMPSELNGGLDMERTVDTQDALVVDVDALAPV